MASPVYARQDTQHAGSFASDTAVLSIGGTNTPLGIVTNLQISFAQQIARIYSITKTNGVTGVPVFYVGGRTQGQASISRVVGPQGGSVCDFYTKMGNVCSPQDLTFTLEAGCSGPAGSESSPGSGGSSTAASGKVTYNVKAAVLTNVGLRVGAQDMIVNEDMTMMFANLQCV